MDRNQVFGWILIGLIVIGFITFQSSQETELTPAKQEQVAEKKSNPEGNTPKEIQATTPSNQVVSVSDSLKKIQLSQEFGIFAGATEGNEKLTLIENDKLQVYVNNKGGYISKVVVKGYQNYDAYNNGEQKDLTLFEGDSSFYYLNFKHNRKLFSTRDFYFASEIIQGTESTTLKSKLVASNGGFIEYIYTIKSGSYLLDFDVNIEGLERDIEGGDNGLDFTWEQYAPSLEKSITLERQTASIFYYSDEEGRDYLSERTEKDQENVALPLKWVALKQQFFSSIIVSKSNEISNADFYQSYNETDSSYVKYFKAKFPLKYESSKSTHNSYNLYFGPNDYDILADCGDDLNLEEELNLGWGIFRMVNRYFIYPVFQFFISLGMSGGIAIILLTFVIKLVLFPITYKNYLSSAKMRVIKPHLEKINEENKDADPMKKQQAVMQLYKQTGVNPLAGCIPALLQMPILYALFRLFPMAIELRHQAFWWADDLSSIDDWIPLYTDNFMGFGNHLSLFTLLMAISMFFYMRFNQQMTPTPAASGSGGSDMQAAIQKNMKVMMNFMPVMMLFFFNNYATGLSFYYLLANVITIAQTLIIKKYIINETSLLEKIEAHMKAPMKKSRWQKKMEEVQQKSKR